MNEDQAARAELIIRQMEKEKEAGKTHSDSEDNVLEAMREMVAKHRKVKFFFELLRGQYGAGKMSTTWPTDKDLQLAIAQWRTEIEKHTEQELSGALTNARRMMATGDDEWMWPNIGLILSGAKGPRRNSAEVQALLDAPPETPEQKAARLAYNRTRIEQLKKLL